MSLFYELTMKARNAATAATEAAKDVADSAKLTAAIMAEKRELDKNYRAIGQWYVCEHKAEVPAAIADIVAAVKESQEKIAVMEASRGTDTKLSGLICPICGKVTDTKFCPQCGAPMGN